MTVLDGKTILVTGGAGSFGRAFLRYALKESDATIRILSRDEFKHQQVHEEFDSDRLRYFIGDVRDESRLYRAAQRADGEYVYAARIGRVVIRHQLDQQA